MTDGHFVGLEGNADSLQLPTVDVLVRQPKEKNWSVEPKKIQWIEQSSVTKPPRLKNKNNLLHRQSDRKNPDAVPEKKSLNVLKKHQNTIQLSKSINDVTAIPSVNTVHNKNPVDKVIIRKIVSSGSKTQHRRYTYCVLKLTN